MEVGGLRLRVAKVSGCNQPEFDQPPLPCRIALLGAPSAALLTWLNQAGDPTAPPRDVTLYELDLNLRAVTRLDLRSARITRIAVSDLDSGSTAAVSLVIDVTGDLVRSDGSGQSVSVGAAGAALRANNFRVSVGGVVFNRISNVAGLEVDFEGPQPALTAGIVTSTGGGGGDLLRGWAADAQAGSLRGLTIELLDTTLASTLLTISAADAGPVGWPEPFATGGTSSRISVGVEGSYTGLS